MFNTNLYKHYPKCLTCRGRMLHSWQNINAHDILPSLSKVSQVLRYNQSFRTIVLFPYLGYTMFWFRLK